jgi:8-oxo-dGTP diphosphatase
MRLSEQYQQALVKGKSLTVRLLYFDQVSLLSNPKLLLLKRPDTGRLAGQMEPPGGKLEPNELPEKGIVREMLEETGVELSKKKLSFAFYLDFTPRQNCQVREFFFIAIGSSRPIAVNPEEHISFTWVPLNQLTDYPLHPVIQSFLNEKKQWIQQFLAKH